MEDPSRPRKDGQMPCTVHLSWTDRLTRYNFRPSHPLARRPRLHERPGVNARRLTAARSRYFLARGGRGRHRAAWAQRCPRAGRVAARPGLPFADGLGGGRYGCRLGALGLPLLARGLDTARRAGLRLGELEPAPLAIGDRGLGLWLASGCRMPPTCARSQGVFPHPRPASRRLVPPAPRPSLAAARRLH